MCYTLCLVTWCYEMWTRICNIMEWSFQKAGRKILFHRFSFFFLCNKSAISALRGQDMARFADSPCISWRRVEGKIVLPGQNTCQRLDNHIVILILWWLHTNSKSKFSCNFILVIDSRNYLMRLWLYRFTPWLWHSPSSNPLPASRRKGCGLPTLPSPPIFSRGLGEGV